MPTPAVSVDQLRATVLGAARPRVAERVALSAAHGLVLARDVHSRWPIPLFDNSAMDGYAVRRDDVVNSPVSLRVIADIPAGSAANPRLRPGEAVRIMTGAPIPDGADAIVPWEQTDLGITVGAPVAPRVTILSSPRENAHIRFAGEDVPTHGLTLRAGTVLGARQLSAAASAGHEHLSVIPRPRVSLIITGNELIDPGGSPRRGQIPDSNSVLLSGCASEAGVDVVSTDRIRDDESALLEALERASGDVVLLCGGASVGAFDVVRTVLGGAGIIDFAAVAMQPGATQGFGRSPNGALVFALPGNPVSAFVSFEVFVRPVLRRMAGFGRTGRPRTLSTAAASWPSPATRTQFMPVRFVEEGVVPTTRRSVGSHRVGTLAQVEALAVVPPQIQAVELGDEVVTWDLRS